MHRKEATYYEKKLPTLTSDAAAESFIAEADLTDYDLSELVPMRFEMKRKDKAVNLRLPEQLLDGCESGPKVSAFPINGLFVWL